MATKLNRWPDTLRKSKLPRSRIERIHREADAELIEMNMRELREAAGKTQAQAAAAASRSCGVKYASSCSPKVDRGRRCDQFEG